MLLLPNMNIHCTNFQTNTSTQFCCEHQIKTKCLFVGGYLDYSEIMNMVLIFKMLPTRSIVSKIGFNFSSKGVFLKDCGNTKVRCCAFIVMRIIVGARFRFFLPLGGISSQTVTSIIINPLITLSFDKLNYYRVKRAILLLKRWDLELSYSISQYQARIGLKRL